MPENNARIRVEFAPYSSGQEPRRELRIVDDTSGLVVTIITLNAEDFTTLMAGGSVTTPAWLLPAPSRGRLDQHRGAVTVHFARFRNDPEELRAWVTQAGHHEDIQADEVTVSPTNHSLAAAFTWYSTEPRSADALAAATALLVTQAREAGFVLDPAWEETQDTASGRKR